MMNLNYTVLHLLGATYIARGAVIFTDESTIRSANDGSVLVYRPQGERYNPQHVYLQTQWSCICPLGLDLPLNQVEVINKIDEIRYE